MNDAITVALIAAVMTGIGYIGKSLKWFYDLSKEQGRAEEYRITSEAAILAKNTEINEQKTTIAFLREQLRDQRTEAEK